MRLTFDYQNNLEQVDLWLCNPDGRELFSLPGRNRNFTLRFNDLSELTFEVDSSVTLPNGAVTKLDAYDYLQVKRLVFATNIGWFQISNVDEHDVGATKYKLVKAESYQAVLKNKGFCKKLTKDANTFLTIKSSLHSCIIKCGNTIKGICLIEQLSLLHFDVE